MQPGIPAHGFVRPMAARSDFDELFGAPGGDHAPDFRAAPGEARRGCARSSARVSTTARRCPRTAARSAGQDIRPLRSVCCSAVGNGVEPASPHRSRPTSLTRRLSLLLKAAVRGRSFAVAQRCAMQAMLPSATFARGSFAPPPAHPGSRPIACGRPEVARAASPAMEGPRQHGHDARSRIRTSSAPRPAGR